MPVQGKKSVRIFDRQRKVNHVTSEEEEVNPLMKRLDDRPVAYFQGELVEDGLKITNEVPNQKW